MLSELIQLGLTSGEARIYLSLLKLGSSKVGSIVKDSRVSYSKVCDVLERLITKGLVSYVTFDIISKYWQVIVIKIVRSILHGALKTNELQMIPCSSAFRKLIKMYHPT